MFFKSIPFLKLSLLSTLFILSGCLIPQALNAPQEAGATVPSEKTKNPMKGRKGLLGFSDHFDNNHQNAAPRAQDESINTRPSSAILTQVSANVWRSTQSASRMFAIVNRVLSQSYVLSRVDRKNLSVQTDWDKFFIDGRLFRNRVHVSVFAVGPRQTEVVVRNNLEYFSGTSEKNSESSSEGQWLPSPDITNEVATFIKGTRLQLQSSARRAD